MASSCAHPNISTNKVNLGINKIERLSKFSRNFWVNFKEFLGQKIISIKTCGHFMWRIAVLTQTCQQTTFNLNVS